MMKIKLKKNKNKIKFNKNNNKIYKIINQQQRFTYQ